jgi:photosystem II stability/assembly factor-like uncharacterized protein
MRGLYSFAAAIFLLTIACSPVASQPLDETPTSGATPATATSAAGWAEVAHSAFNFQGYYAGFNNDQYGIVIGLAGQVEYTRDGGQTWNLAVNHSLCRFGLDIVDDNIAWHCGNGGNVGLSVDGGKTWTRMTNWGGSEPDGQCRYLSFADAASGWAATPQKLAQTVDGANSWQELPLAPSTTDILAVAFLSKDTGYVLDTNLRLNFTRDGGATWTDTDLKGAVNAGVALTVAKSPLAAMRF